MDDSRDFATEPGQLTELFIRYANAGDVEGLVSLYAEDAVLAVGEVKADGREEIRGFYADLLERRREFPPPEMLDPIVQGDTALTMARAENGNLSVELARRQPDGRWLWSIDQLRVPR